MGTSDPFVKVSTPLGRAQEQFIAEGSVVAEATWLKKSPVESPGVPLPLLSAATPRAYWLRCSFTSYPPHLRIVTDNIESSALLSVQASMPIPAVPLLAIAPTLARSLVFISSTAGLNV